MEWIGAATAVICIAGFALEALAMLALAFGPLRRRLPFSPFGLAGLGFAMWLAGALGMLLTGDLSRW